VTSVGGPTPADLWARVRGYGRSLWTVLRPIALVAGIVFIAIIVALLAKADFFANRAVEHLFANARAPTDRELPPTAHAMSYASADVQPLGGQGALLSCSVPGILERAIFPRRGDLSSISLRMRQACAFHDYCYRHGAATYGYSQADCDYLLLEHAYRICRFVNRQYTVQNCVTDARKVLLGVRLGGREAFKHSDRVTPALRAAERRCAIDERRPLANAKALPDDSCTSSYFEFNPYPIRAQAYTVYRVADAPINSEPTLRKALYLFEIRPAGTRITIVAFTRDRLEIRCTRLQLPGGFDYLSVPPLVVKSSGGGELEEDWFVWWRRFNLDQTGGRLTIVAPRRATASDWAKAFPGAAAIPASASERQHPSESCLGLSLPEASASGARPSWRILQIGSNSDKRDDAEFSELHPAPGFHAPDGTIRLMALRTHTCGKQKRPWYSLTKNGEMEIRSSNILCFHEVVIDPAKSGDDDKQPYFQESEPYVVRDAINRWHEGTVHGDLGDGIEPDRYRNFVTPPIAIARYTKPQARLLSDKSPVLAWLRRGERRGETYAESALLRRADHKGKIGKGLPVIRLAGFEEWADPVFVLDRTGRPQLISLREDSENRRKIKMHRWVIPRGKRSYPTKVGDRCAKTPNWSEERSLNDCARAIVPRSEIAVACTRELDASWLVRRPIALPSVQAGGSADIVFTRAALAPIDGRKPEKRSFQLQLKIATINAAGSCKLSDAGPHPLPSQVDRPPAGDDSSTDVRAWQERTGVILADLRAIPALVADLEPNARFLILPNSKRIGETGLFRLSPGP
jgi:hypothetical protein